MTKLSKPVSREVTGLDGKPMIATLTAEGLLLREKGKRKAFLMPYDYAYARAAMLEADRIRAHGGTKRRPKVKRGLLGL